MRSCMSYVELHLHSCFSFLDGLHGAMEHAQACKALGIRPITGAEVTLDDGSHLTLLCEDAAGYRNLCLLLTRAHAGTREWTDSGTPRRVRPPSVTLIDVERHADGLVCLSGCARDGAVG